MRGIRLNALSVSNFRGINDSVRFDFSSPLTVVYAPNGTGKTTMCEAAEWLLTGQVERLREGNIFDVSVLSSKFSTNDDTTASASAYLLIDGVQKFVQRVVDQEGSSGYIGAEEGKTDFFRPSEFLGHLAPAGASDDANGTAAINLRQRWLKGTRFLSSEALAALVDTDQKTIERRTEVFADLLGIRHLLDAERQCDKYIAELGRRLKNLNNIAESRSAEMVDLELALGPYENAELGNKNSARMEADSAADLLPLEDVQWFKEQGNLDDQLASLTAIHRRNRHALDLRLDAAKRVEAKWKLRESLEEAVAKGISSEDSLTQSLAQIEKDGKKVAGELANNKHQKEVTYQVSHELAMAQDELSRLSAQTVSVLLDAKLVDDLSLNFTELSNKYPESKWPKEARQQRRSDLKKLETSGIQLKIDRLAELESLISFARAVMPSSEQIDQLYAQVSEADLNAAAATKLLDTVASPVVRLQAAARELLDHDHGVDVSKCPLCSHDWSTSSQLKDAIEETLSASPELIIAARNGVTIAHAAAKLAKIHLDRALTNRAHSNRLENERSELELSIEYNLREQERLGINKEATPEIYAEQATRLNIADSIFSLQSALDRISPATLNSQHKIQISECSISNLIENLEIIISANNHLIQLHLADLTSSIESATAQRDDLRAQYAEAQESLKDSRLSLEDATLELASLHSAWQDAWPETEWFGAELESLMLELTKESARLHAAESHIEAARAAWSAESRRSRLSELQQATQHLITQLKVMSAKFDAAKRARAMFHEAYTTISHQKVHDLSQVVNPLFARMHANRVFDRINLGADSNFLHWLADAGDQQLDPGKDFSQGQRQDLALALFLARARSLGGTFFLDEPIVHLDDLNRVGLLDILRATVLENSNNLNLVITTSSRALARHLIEKFASIAPVETHNGRQPPLRILELDGNGRSGIRLNTVYPLGENATPVSLEDEFETS